MGEQGHYELITLIDDNQILLGRNLGGKGFIEVRNTDDL